MEKRELRRHKAGSGAPIMVLILIGIALVAVGVAFAFTKGSTWVTPTGFILFGLAVFAAASAVVSPTKVWSAVIALVLGVAGAALLIGHYAGWW